MRGQYQGYRDEAGVTDDSATETYAALRLEIDSWRWAGVPFYLRAGKTLADTVTEAIVEFREPPRLLFGEPGPRLPPFRNKISSTRAPGWVHVFGVGGPDRSNACGWGSS